MVSNVHFGLNKQSPHVRLLRDRIIPREMTRTLVCEALSLERLETMVVFDRNKRGRLELWHCDQSDFRVERHLEAVPDPDIGELIRLGRIDPSECVNQRMWLVPLGQRENPGDAPWRCSRDIGQTTNLLQAMILSNCSLKTAADPDLCSLYALMSLPTASTDLARTGVLFVRDMDGNFHPLTWESGQSEFLIEGKGLGNPLSLRLGHHRLSGPTMTGGIKTEEVEKEVHYNELMRKHSRAFAAGRRVRALAGTVSKLDPFMNQFLRLSPTNRRAAWGGNPIFPNMSEPAIVEQLAYALGEDVGELIALPEPFFHGSSHPANLVLFGNRGHCLTDFSNSYHWSANRPCQLTLYNHMEAVSQFDGFTGDAAYFAFLKGMMGSLVLANIVPNSWQAKVLSASDPKVALRTIVDRISPRFAAFRSSIEGNLRTESAAPVEAASTKGAKALTDPGAFS